jgi:hypothetical protein
MKYQEPKGNILPEHATDFVLRCLIISGGNGVAKSQERCWTCGVGLGTAKLKRKSDNNTAVSFTAREAVAVTGTLV